MSVRVYDFVMLGRYDCGHTFDRQAFPDIRAGALARKVPHYKTRSMTQNFARNLARVALERSENWESPVEWGRHVSFSEQDTDLSLQAAYDAWKRGYVSCAAERLAEWILEEMEV